jgi:hypothetical protein
MLPLAAVRGELRIQRPAWHTAVRQVLGRQQACAWGPLRWHAAGRDLLLLVDQLQPAPQLPRGDLQPPHSGWCVVVGEPSGATASPSSVLGNLLPTLQVRPGQQVVVVVLPAGGESAVQAFWTDGLVVHPLASLVVVGAGQRPLQPATNEPRPAAPLLEAAVPHQTSLRHSRTAGGLGEALFARLRHQTVTVVGLGRLGWQAAFGLAGMGIGQLRLIDADVVGPENLDAMPGVVEGDVGRRKIEVAAARLTEFQPGLVVQGVAEGMEQAGGRQLAARRCDLLVTTVDDDAARLAVSLLAAETLTPHLDLGSSLQREAEGRITRQGDCRLLMPGRGCVACVGGLADRDGVLERLRGPVGSLRRGRRPEWQVERAGSLGYWNGIVVGCGLELYLGLLRGEHDSFWQRLWWQPGEGLESRGSGLERAPDCVFCGRWTAAPARS